jgi:hypothetical protein
MRAWGPIMRGREYRVESPHVIVFVDPLALLLKGMPPEDVQEAAYCRSTVEHPGGRAGVGGAGVEPGFAVDLQYRQIPQRLLVRVEPTCKGQIWPTPYVCPSWALKVPAWGV